MILAIPAGTPWIYYREINFIVELVSIITFFVVAAILLIRKEGEIATARRIKIGYSLFSIFYAMCRIFFIVAVWYPDEVWSADSYKFFVVIGYFFACVGLTSMVLVVEKYLITKTHHIFTVIGFAVSVLYFLAIFGAFGLTQAFVLQISYVSSPLLTVVIVILYLYLAVKGAAELRRKALLILLSIALIGVSAIVDGEKLVINAGLMFDSDLFLDLYYSIPPLILIVGILLFLKNTY